MLTTHPLLVPRSRKSRSCTSCHPNAPLWGVTGPFYFFLALTWKMRNEYNTFVRETEEERKLKDLDVDVTVIIKLVSIKRIVKGVKWIQLPQESSGGLL
jgi:hypothetical protein